MEDFQLYLKELVVEDCEGWKDVKVLYGNISSIDLAEWTRRYTQQSMVRVEFWKMTCNISPDDRNSIEEQQRLASYMKDIEHGGIGLFHKLTVKEIAGVPEFKHGS